MPCPSRPPSSPVTNHLAEALKADTPQELITIDSDYLSRVTLRRSLIARHGATVHGCTPPGRAAVAELYAYLVSSYLPARYPSLFQLTTGPLSSPALLLLLHNLVTGKKCPATPPEDADAALRILGETVEEDLFLLRETPRGHESTAFVCCFPLGFDPSEKLGRLLSEIHAPVPGYDRIAASMERFFGRLEVGKSVKRMNVCMQSPPPPFFFSPLTLPLSIYRHWRVLTSHRQWSVQTHDQLFICKGNHILANDDSYTPDEDVDISKVCLSTIFFSYPCKPQRPWETFQRLRR